MCPVEGQPRVALHGRRIELQRLSDNKARHLVNTTPPISDQHKHGRALA